MKKFLIFTGTLVAVLVLVMYATGNSHVFRTISLTIFRGKLGPDIDELKDFPYRTLKTIHQVEWPRSVNYNRYKPSAELLANSQKYETVAFVVIQNDSLVYENYSGNFNEKSVGNSFSMAKSFTSILIGCALKDGYIKSLDEPVANYVDAYRKPAYDKITIRHLLMMSSGLDFKESYGSLFGWPAKAYYGTDVNATTIDPPKVNEPGKVYEYKGGDTQLLGMILEKATGKHVADYAADRLWKPLNAEADAYWSLDVEGGMEKVSCCYYATARDFARFGKLYLQMGNWNGIQIVDTTFVKQSIVAAPTVTSSGEPNSMYGYQWWIMNYKNSPVFYARGIRGQYIFCVPDKKLIIVRLGHKRADKKGDELPSDIYDFLEMGFQASGLGN